MLTERNVRRALNKAGYFLRKCRHTGGYMIVDLYGNYVVAGAEYELALDDVQEWLCNLEG